MGDTANEKVRVAYLGPPASFSHQAALAVFPAGELLPSPSFTAIFGSLQPNQEANSASASANANVTFAILPIENSTNGSVTPVLDLLAQCSQHYPDLEVCAEHYLSVHHYLFTNHDRQDRQSSAKLSSIQTLYTHPQVWTQCSKYLGKHLQHAEKIDVSSTSKAATLVKEAAAGSDVNRVAAICSKLAGEQAGLKCVAEELEDDATNTTRFFVLRNRRTSPPAAIVAEVKQSANEDINVKSLLLFTISHTTPGSLSKALEVFAKHGLNLTRIDTRPSKKYSWHYVFFVECEERLRIEQIRQESAWGYVGKLGNALIELTEVTESVVCLGRWKDMLEGLKS